jgi:hypothetical protein
VVVLRQVLLALVALAVVVLELLLQMAGMEAQTPAVVVAVR